MLRAKEMGFSLDELDQITLGMFYGVLNEKSNDGVEYADVASQADFDEFANI